MIILLEVRVGEIKKGISKNGKEFKLLSLVATGYIDVMGQKEKRSTVITDFINDNIDETLFKVGDVARANIEVSVKEGDLKHKILSLKNSSGGK